MATRHNRLVQMAEKNRRLAGNNRLVAAITVRSCAIPTAG
jgi:hypothetical protein